MRMIDPADLDMLRLRTCAVCALKVPRAQFVENPNALMQPILKIIGTGFLVAPRTVLTNRHVASNLLAYCKRERLSEDERVLMFGRPHGDAMVQSAHKILRIAIVTDPKWADVALIRFAVDDGDPVGVLSPVPLLNHFRAEVGDPMVVYGYAYGDALMKRPQGDDDGVYRFGPILHHGYVSAIAPFDHSSLVDRLLLDVRTAKGMSGSPVFDPLRKEVVAVHDAGIDGMNFEGMIAFGLPISADLIATLMTNLGPGLDSSGPGPTDASADAPFVRRAPRD
jgi:S1-C subfamily serine protease